MTVGTASGPAGSRRQSRALRIAFFAPFIVGIAALWEGTKVLGGDPFRVDGVVVWTPPLDIGLASEPNAHYVLVSTREHGNNAGPVEFRSFRIIEGTVTEEEVTVVEQLAPHD